MKTLFPKHLQQPGLGQEEAGSQELGQPFQAGWQVSTLHPLLLPLS